MKMFRVTSTVSPHIVCSSMVSCGGDGNNDPSAEGSSAIWYSCPACSHRLCSSCALVKMETPQPMYNEVEVNISEHQDTNGTVEKLEEKIDMDGWSEEKHNGSAPIPGMVE